jgi:hypothetical protein
LVVLVYEESTLDVRKNYLVSNLGIVFLYIPNEKLDDYWSPNIVIIRSEM